jgi:hypothetical protein
VWTGGGADQLASNPQNWHPIGVPGPGDSASFDGVGNGTGNPRKHATFDLLGPGNLAGLSITNQYFSTVWLDRSVQADTLIVSATAPPMGASHGRIHVNAGHGLSTGQGTISAGEITGPGSFAVNVGASPVFNITGQCAINTSTWNIVSAATVNISARLNVGAGTTSQQG